MLGALIIEHLEAEGIDFLDLQPSFVEDPRCLYMNDTHWIPAGHRLTADRIASRILENGHLQPPESN